MICARSAPACSVRLSSMVSTTFGRTGERIEMTTKPSFLGPKYGSAFEDPTVVGSYRLRPPYPDEAFDLLAGLLASRPGAVLDLGCGTGIVARRLVGLSEHVTRVDALDASPAMIAEARRLPNG